MRTLPCFAFVVSSLVVVACSSVGTPSDAEPVDEGPTCASKGGTCEVDRPGACYGGKAENSVSCSPDTFCCVPPKVETCAAMGGKCSVSACVSGTESAGASDCESCCIPAPRPSCASKGGACTPDVPGACADGTVEQSVGNCGNDASRSLCCVPNTKPSCGSLGGICVPVVPDSCSGGDLDPRGSCGAGVGVTCCIKRKAD
jgi:hypothetical protein